VTTATALAGGVGQERHVRLAANYQSERLRAAQATRPELDPWGYFKQPCASSMVPAEQEPPPACAVPLGNPTRRATPFSTLGLLPGFRDCRGRARYSREAFLREIDVVSRSVEEVFRFFLCRGSEFTESLHRRKREKRESASPACLFQRD
jgi:hypothetical protein